MRTETTDQSMDTQQVTIFIRQKNRANAQAAEPKMGRADSEKRFVKIGRED